MIETPVPPGPAFGITLEMIGFTTRYVKDPSCTLDPVFRFVISMGPVMSAQPAVSAGPGTTTISVAETDWMIAPQPASSTATGAWKPRPKIVMGRNGPPSGCTLLLKPVMIIGSV